MRLSEAIRLGAMLKPQGFGAVSNGIATCAWGAAFEAIGRLHEGKWPNSRHIWPWIARADGATCPACGETPGFFPSIISAHLNDDHRWTREQIADWVETIERQHENLQTVQHENLQTVQQENLMVEQPQPVAVEG